MYQRKRSPQRALKSAILSFLGSAVAFISMIVALVTGSVRSSNPGRYGRITAMDKPINFWTTVAFLGLLWVCLLGFALWSAYRYRQLKNGANLGGEDQ